MSKQDPNTKNLIIDDNADTLEQQSLATENKRLIQELKDLKKKYKEVEQRKSEFVATVSHEFKSPLAIIQTSLSLILDGLTGDISDKQKEIITRAQRVSGRLINLVKDMLDLTRIEMGIIPLKREPLNFVALLQNTIEEYDILVKNKEQKLSVKFPSDTNIIWGDKDRLTEAFINLFNNAIKYTQEQGCICVSLIEENNFIRCEIADTGPGIPNEFKEKIFDKFERILADKKQEGTGLGLPIAKDIIELHHGKIWVEDNPGGGSLFIFTIPKDLRKSDALEQERLAV
jgi:two-component system, NtrC family, sensor histidine kinase KinB